MPRYFFHFGDGKHNFTDSTGIELAGVANVRAHAQIQIRDMRAAPANGRVQDWSGWEMSVLDHAGRIVLVLGFDLLPRPIHPDRRAVGAGRGTLLG